MLTLLLVYAVLLLAWSAVPRVLASRAAAASAEQDEGAAGAPAPAERTAPPRRRVPAAVAATVALWR